MHRIYNRFLNASLLASSHDFLMLKIVLMIIKDNSTFKYCMIYQLREGLLDCDIVRPNTKPKEIPKLVHE